MLTAQFRDIFLGALERIHSAGISHNDIRLQNLLVNDANEISIIDFDSATHDLEDAEDDIETLSDTVVFIPDDSTDSAESETASDDDHMEHLQGERDGR